MTEPESWSTRDPNTVTAKYTGIYGELMEDVTIWVTSLLPVPAESNVIVFPTGNVLVQNGSFELSIAANQYVYVDEDGFHAVSKGSFEMLYKKDPPA